MPANTNPNPNCHACHGTGEDASFGGACGECQVDANRAEMVAARYAGVRTDPRTDRFYTPGERLDGRRFGRGNGGSQRYDNRATDRQIAFIETLVAERIAAADTLTDEDKQTVRMARHLLRSNRDGSNPMTHAVASPLIESLKAIRVRRDATAPAATPDRPTPVRTNRYASSCGRCGHEVAAEAGTLARVEGRWVAYHVDGDCPAKADEPTTTGLDLRPLERYASNGRARFGVPGADTRLKVQITFRRSGRIYVDDGAEYGQGRSYGRQIGDSYRGDIAAELAAILDDPMAALRRYAELTSNCGVCGRKLEDEDSVARGIGPICARRIG